MTLEEKYYNALLDCVRHSLPAMEDAAIVLAGSIQGTKLKLWARNLRDHLPETLELEQQKKNTPNLPNGKTCCDCDNRCDCLNHNLISDCDRTVCVYPNCQFESVEE